ncbi:helix-turn-helix domain-containing protein [Oceanobacillus kapialis]|uniref:helix-turn-helix domain-containing protein n=1 Tax=Oceanobacillus kapialis TaxID=481353 RepID=UPI00384FB878
MKALGYIARFYQVTMTDIAKEMEVTPQTVNDWVKGKRNIPPKRLELLAKMFNLPSTYFSKGEQELNEVERLEIEKAKLQMENEYIFPEGSKYPYFSKQDEINRINNKLEEKRLFQRMEKLFEGGTRLEDEDFNWKAVRNYMLLNSLVGVLEEDSISHIDLIEHFTKLLLGSEQIESFKMAEDASKMVKKDRDQ